VFQFEPLDKQDNFNSHIQITLLKKKIRNMYSCKLAVVVI